MKHRKARKVLPLLLALCMVVGMIPAMTVTAGAAEEGSLDTLQADTAPAAETELVCTCTTACERCTVKDDRNYGYRDTVNTKCPVCKNKTGKELADACQGTDGRHSTQIIFDNGDLQYWDPHGDLDIKNRTSCTINFTDDVTSEGKDGAAMRSIEIYAESIRSVRPPWTYKYPSTTVTIEGNGHTLEWDAKDSAYNGTGSAPVELFRVYGLHERTPAKLIIKNLTIHDKSGSLPLNLDAIWVMPYGEVELENVHIICGGDENHSNTAVGVSGGKVTIGPGCVLEDAGGNASVPVVDIRGKSYTGEVILNGGTIQATSRRAAVRLQSGSKFTMDDGLVSGAQCAIYMQSDDLTKPSTSPIEAMINGGTVQSTGDSATNPTYPYAVALQDTSPYTKFVVNGGLITSKQGGIFAFSPATSDAEIHIDGGTIESTGDDQENSKKYAAIYGGKVSMTAGTVSCKADAGVISRWMEISGGTIRDSKYGIRNLHSGYTSDDLYMELSGNVQFENNSYADIFFDNEISDNQKGIDITGFTGNASVITYYRPSEDTPNQLFAENAAQADVAKFVSRPEEDYTVLFQDGKLYLTEFFQVTFDTNGGSEIPAQTIAIGGSIIKPDNPSKEENSFFGWYTDPEYTTTWDFDVDTVTADMTLYARWSTEPLYAISGKVQKDAEPAPEAVSGVSVELKKGNEVIATTVTDADGSYTFPYVLVGEYNIVASKAENGEDAKIKTTLIAVSDSDQTDMNILLPKGSVNSVLEVKDGTPAVVVGGLDDAVADMAETDKSVTLTLTVEAQDKTSVPADAATAIKRLAGGKVLMYVDMAVNKTVKETGQPDVVTSIKDTGEVLEIVVPFQTSGRKNITVYRYHDDGAGNATAEVFTALNDRPASDYQDGTFFVGDGFLVIYAQKFSTYAIGYDRPVPVILPVMPGAFGLGGYENCPKDITCPIWRYTDVSTTAWYHDGVHYCIENGYMTGYGSNLFGPNDTTSRAMIVTMLWRQSGSPIANYALSFEDVAEDAWYADAIRWAVSEGVAGGYGNGKFGPNDSITREQMVTMLYRYAKYKGYDVSVGEDTNILSYLDFDQIDAWAIPAIQWACGSGIMKGKSGGRLDPLGSATRAEAATIFMRYCEMPAARAKSAK